MAVCFVIITNSFPMEEKMSEMEEENEPTSAEDLLPAATKHKHRHHPVIPYTYGSYLPMAYPIYYPPMNYYYPLYSPMPLLY